MEAKIRWSRWRFGPAFVILGVFLVVNALLGGSSSDTESRDVTLDELKTLVAEDKVAIAEIRVDSDVVVGTLVPEEGEEEGAEFETRYPDGFEGEITALLLDSLASTTVERGGTSALSVILALLPLLLLVALGVFFFRRRSKAQGGMGGIMSIRRSTAKRVTSDQPTATFSDVAGLDEAIVELDEIKDFLEAPSRFTEMGATVPKGVLLTGPPGTGKTLLARAVAGESGVPFFSISGSDFVEMFVGVGASRVRDLFKQAKAEAPAIIFIDEIDAVGRRRGGGIGGGNDEREQTLNQLLVEMDGFVSETSVVVMAATNRPDVLDPALLRPGRFDRQIIVDRPDLQGRIAILNVHAKGKPLDDEVDLEVVARRTPGFTGADLANVLNEATLLATRRGHTTVRNDELEDAVDKVIAGPERKGAVLSASEQRVIAYHEAGHALVGWALPCADPIHKVTIIPRGKALGYTQALPTEDRHIMHRSQLWNQLAMLAGGRAAVELVFQDPTTGASNDLEEATEIAHKMVVSFGMSERLGFMRLGHTGETFLGHELGRTPTYSDDTASVIDDEVRALLDQSQAEADTILLEHRKVLDTMAEALLERETLDKDAIDKLLAAVPKWKRTGESSGVIEPAPELDPDDAGAPTITAI